MKPARSLTDLVAAGLMTEADAAAMAGVADRYAVALTPYVLDRLAGAAPDDPVAVQYIPAPAEAYSTEDELADPIGDHSHSPVKGIVHRYPDRVLLKPLHACAVYCRFCFRREMVGPGGDALSAGELDAALAYVRSRPEIWEVIVTGGDPFLLAPRRLRAIVQAVAAMGHVGVIRFHTRIPVADPARVTPELVAALRADGIASWVAVHVNHAAEMTPEAAAAAARLADAGIPLLGQSVLLKGVNDEAAVLEALFRALVRNRIKPYYLHHPDLAPGTSHFRPSVERGQDLVDALRGHVSGLCQPTYVLDIPGGHGKAPIGRCAIETHGGDGHGIRDYQGRRHRYPG
ncbi:lysine-2,3-aminomutase-like protein [Azospirillum sp. RWY-5-1]|uniref:Lysine-2,3-aminomutase-like protein n=1 Tax=Azospirillum oleiclasticum TaxID=2735135 RepID=A0ABX2T8R8_9PROT|nr:lysine-2,3-aminomutase-like protein [Azospirillum oleiclasticum]NYZ13127.1 lysine-2,3-aminomutase-like protein [Azospirillum oleiclasticum]NYZ20200.1 lysine-2,3-aminomutase-like protein [Azospirillum oleiclasticum]